MKKIIAFSFVCFMIVSSCSKRPEFVQFYEFDNTTWNRLNTLSFDVPVQSTSKQYDFYLEMYLDSTFSHNIVTYNFTMDNPSGEFRTKDYRYRLIDRYGRLLLIPIDGGFLLKRQLQNGYSFSEKGISHMELRNTMDKYEIKGIKKIGLVIVKH